MASNSGRTYSSPNFCCAAVSTRTGPHASCISSTYCSGSSRPSLSIDSDITCHWMAKGRWSATSSSHRDVSQVHGQTGSNQKSTRVAGESVAVMSVVVM